MKSDLQHVTASKNAMRRRLAKRPFAEKVRLLEELSERTLATRKDTSLPLPHEPWPIPDHWQWSTMGDVATVVGGGTPRTDRAEYFGGSLPWITPADLSGYHDKTITRGSRNITEEGLANSGARLLPADTVLFSSRAPIGYVAIAANPVATNQGFKSFVLKSHLDSSFVYYYLQRAKPLATALASGTTFLEISGKNAARLPIPVPPIAEQRQIVAEIEKQFTRLEAGVAALRRVQANLKRYRASVFKAACEGRLVPTEAELARSEGRSYETADQLLARCLTCSQKAKSMPHSVEGWVRCAIGSISEVCIGSTPSRAHPEYWGGTIAWVSSGEVSFCKINTTREEITELGFENSSVKLHPPGTVLLAMIGEGKTRGQAALLEISAANSQNSAALRPSPVVLPKFLYYFLCGRYEETRKTSSGNNQPALNKGRVQQIVVPIPPLAEQTRIVAELDRRLSVLDQLETVVNANLQRATRLRQSILQRAFVGSPGR